MKIKNYNLLLGAMIIVLSSCSHNNAAPLQESAEQKWTYENQLAAPQELTKSQLSICVNSYKEKMNDPSSFSLAGGGAKKIIGVVVDDAVLYTANIRGKNSFGGVILSKMNCTFKYDAKTNKLNFVYAWN